MLHREGVLVMESVRRSGLPEERRDKHLRQRPHLRVRQGEGEASEHTLTRLLALVGLVVDADLLRQTPLRDLALAVGEPARAEVVLSVRFDLPQSQETDVVG